MTDRETFLERWSRRKREAEEPSEQVHTTKVRQPADDRVAELTPAPSPAGEKSDSHSAQPATADFDLTKLPPIESITAATDVRAFLAPGVPQHLVRAALRRAWASDPAIRDFVGLQDYDWDFVTPGAVPGFGELAADDDVRKMLTRLLGGTDEPSAPVQLADRRSDQSNVESAPEGQESRREMPALADDAPKVTYPDDVSEPDASAMEEAGKVEPVINKTKIVHRDNITAAQRIGSEDQFEQSLPRRKHGGALPK